MGDYSISIYKPYVSIDVDENLSMKRFFIDTGSFMWDGYADYARAAAGLFWWRIWESKIRDRFLDKCKMSGLPPEAIVNQFFWADDDLTFYGLSGDNRAWMVNETYEHLWREEAEYWAENFARNPDIIINWLDTEIFIDLDDLRKKAFEEKQYDLRAFLKHFQVLEISDWKNLKEDFYGGLSELSAEIRTETVPEVFRDVFFDEMEKLIKETCGKEFENLKEAFSCVEGTLERD